MRYGGIFDYNLKSERLVEVLRESEGITAISDLTMIDKLDAAYEVVPSNFTLAT